MNASRTCLHFQIIPQKLLVEERLDIAVKWRFFRYLYTGKDPDSERVYLWHIEKRTGGKEPHSWKQSLDDYVTGCEYLLKSMKEKGFDRDHPIEYGKNGKIIGGAHRLACSLFLEIKAYCVIIPKNGTATWGEKWFIRHGIDPHDLRDLNLIWTQLKNRDNG